MNEARVVAVVVTYNRLEKLQECVAALRAQTHRLAQMVVVDNGSTDGTAAWLEQQLSSQVPLHVLLMGDNVGGAGGFAAGLEYALTLEVDWVWLLDDDAMANPEAVAQLMQSPTAQETDVAALVSRAVGPIGEAVNIPGRFDRSRLVFRDIALAEFDQPAIEVDTASFVGFMVRAVAAREVGLPRADFFIYYDDAEYSMRLRQRYRVVVVPRSVIVHKYSISYESGDYMAVPQLWKKYYQNRNELQLLLGVIEDRGDRARFLGRQCLFAVTRAMKCMRLDHPWWRMDLEVRAYLDGSFGRMGKRVDPTAFRSMR